MLGRRILRIKAFKVLYGYAVTGRQSLEDVMVELEKSCEATRDLYLFMLSVIPALTAESARRIGQARGKFNPAESDLHPNMKFVENMVAPILEKDVDFQKIMKRKGFSWEQYDIFLNSVLDSMGKAEYFQKYMASGERSLKEDCRLMVKMFEKEFVDSEQLAGILEDISIYWTDDLAYSLTFCCRTMEDFSKGVQWRLPDLYQSEMLLRKNPKADVQSDHAFVTRLLKNAFAGYKEYFSLITSSVTGWEADRLNCSDIALVVLGLAEAETFPEIPLRVTINEYVEISKFYSMPKSGSFVNGLLDRLINKLIEQGKIVKKL